MAEHPTIHLVVKFSPPQAATKDVSPREYLLLSPVKRSIRKASHTYDLPESTSPNKRMRLDPAEIDDNLTLRHYTRRTESKNLRVAIPFEDRLQNLLEHRKEREDLKNTIADITARLCSLENLCGSLLKDSCELRKETLELRKENSDMHDRLTTMETQMAELRQSRLTMYVANALIELVRRLSKPTSGIRDHSVTDLVQFAAKLKDERLKQEGIPHKWWPKLRKLDQQRELRNKAAHETGVDFARFLAVNPIEYAAYHELVEVSYLQTVEQLVGSQTVE